MFLAWNEMKYSKTRFALIIGVVILVSFLVYFLTGLAYGLSQDNRTGVDKWEADAIVLTEESNANISMSTMPISQRDEVDVDEVAVLSQTQGVVHLEGQTDDEDQINVSFFGIDSDEFIMPEVIDGDEFSDDFEAIADISLQEEEGIEIGDTLILAGAETEITIVGFTEGAKFNITPILYTTVPTVQEVQLGAEAMEAAGEEEEQVSALVIRDENVEDIELDNEDLDIYSISDYILELPGYTAQLLTFALMIGFLIIIAAIVIGIFMYVLTVQKSSLFGVMKAQGIPTSYIAKSVVMQTFLLATIGTVIGLLLTIGSDFLLPATVPFQSNPYFFLGITLLLIVFAVLGAFFSVRTIVKIDPLEAMD